MNNYKFLCIILLFYVYNNIVKAQSTCYNKQYEENILKNFHSDSPKKLNDLSQKYLFTETEKAFVFSKAALRTSIKYKNKVEEARAWYYLGNVFNITGKNDKAFQAYTNSLKIRSIIKDKEGISKVLNNMGVVKVNMGKYPEAIDFYNKALKYKLKLLDTNGSAGTLANIANTYFLMGKYKESFEFNHKALMFYEMTNNLPGIAVCMNHLGAIYENWNDFKNALNSYSIAYKLEKLNNNQDEMADALNNIGNVLNKAGRYEDALNKYHQALEIRKKTGNLKGIASTLNNTGTVYTKLGKNDLAGKYYYEALKISTSIKSEYEITVNLYAIGNNYMVLSQYRQAKPFFEKSLSYAQKNKLRELIADNYKALSEVYSNIGLYNKAYLNLIKYIAIKDSIFSKETHNRMVEIRARYETEKKQKEIELLKRNMLIQQLQSEKREQQLNLKLSIWLSAAGFLLFIALSVLIMLRLIQRRKLIQAEQKALRAQMNPHFIFNALNSIQSTIIEKDEEAARRYLNRFSQLMRKILENSGKPEVSLREELNTINLYLELENLRFTNRFEYTFDISNKIDLDECKVPPMLIQPLLENAILHGLIPSSEKGLLYIGFLLNNGFLKVIVRDNGIGRKKAAEISKKRINHNSTGMKNIQERIALLKKVYGGNIQLKIIDLLNENNEGTGTQAELILPSFLAN